MVSSVANTTSGSAIVDAMLKGVKWDTSTVSQINFNFSATSSYYPAGYNDGLTNPINMATFEVATASVQATVRKVLLGTSGIPSQFGSVANVTFAEVASTAPQNFNGATTGADLTVGMADLTGGGRAFQPGTGRRAGDVWFDGNPTNPNRFENILKGDNDWRVVIHEIGHAMGLRHPHEAEVGDLSQTVIPAAQDSMEFSVMTYRMYPNATDLGDTTYPQSVETYGYAQSLMMYDIAALQAMYGANFGAAAKNGNTAYTFSSTTGEMFIDGVGQGVPGANRLFLTIWDGGGVDTYNLSNYTTSVTIDLTPGSWSVTSTAQLAILDEVTGLKARGNVYNALQFNGDARSLIENAVGGSGADTLIGNSLGNSLSGGAGADSMDGRGGNDFYTVDNAGDNVIELANGGQDTVAAYVNYSLASRPNVENIRAYGSATQITGHDGYNTLIGTTSAAAQQLIGLGGPDYYYIGANDTIVEAVGGGTDYVYVDFSGYIMAANVDHLIMLGTAGLSATGNDIANFFLGNAGNNTMSGGLGNDRFYGFGGTDTFTGGGGFDNFVFNSAIGPATVDTITDFVVADDTNLLARGIFTAAGPAGYLAAAAFKNLASGVKDADDRIIYDGNTGALSYDADGSGAAVEVKFAQLSSGLNLSNFDFILF